MCGIRVTKRAGGEEAHRVCIGHVGEVIREVCVTVRRSPRPREVGGALDFSNIWAMNQNSLIVTNRKFKAKVPDPGGSRDRLRRWLSHYPQTLSLRVIWRGLNLVPLRVPNSPCCPQEELIRVHLGSWRPSSTRLGEDKKVAGVL